MSPAVNHNNNACVENKGTNLPSRYMHGTMSCHDMHLVLVSDKTCTEQAPESHRAQPMQLAWQPLVAVIVVVQTVGKRCLNMKY